jgi:hypothetical protein
MVMQKLRVCRNGHLTTAFANVKEQKQGCLICAKISQVKIYAKNKEKVKARSKARYHANSTELKQKIRSRCLLNPIKVKRYLAAYYIKNKAKYLAFSSGRRAVKRRATPSWVDKKALLDIYKNRPAGMHVDHIVPLCGKTVCGLHVPWNLIENTLIVS